MNRSPPPIAVVGVSALFPGSVDKHGFWRDILSGRDLITDVPPSHWLIEDYYDPDPKAPDKTYCRRGAFLPDVDFDPIEFGIPPSIVPATDTAQLLALIVAQRVLADACGGDFKSVDRERASIILGVTSAQELMLEMTSRLQKPIWRRALRESGIPEAEVEKICDRIANSYTPWQEATFPGLLGNVVAGRIANRLDLHGTNTVTDAACASALSALSMGLNELYLGQSDLVIAGGVDTMNDISMFVCFSKTPALSPTGDCRPFSDNGDGTILGEGLGMVALRRLEDAERDGNRIYAVIRGLGTSSDGRGPSVYAPLAEGQARALRRAYDNAGYGPDTVELVEAHGTGTKAGDAAEFGGLQQVFDETGRKDRQWCALGSVKSQIGHTKAAAGSAGLFKAVMALHHRVIPPTAKIDRPNPKLKLESSAFWLPTKAIPWIRSSDHPRRASLSSFGFGGSNFHVTLEEYTGSAPAARERVLGTELFVFGAPDAAGLAAAARAAAAGLDGADRFAWRRLARSTQAEARANAFARLSLVAAGPAELQEKLRAAAMRLEREPVAFFTPDGVHAAIGASDAGKLAFVFPGQGSQYVGMGAELAMTFDRARAPWDASADATFDGEAVHVRVFPRSVFDDGARAAQERALTATEWAQPAIGVASLATLGLLRDVGLVADTFAGHSFGEVTALCAAGVFEERSLVTVARARGAAMAAAATSASGAMTAVTGAVEVIRARLEAWGADVVVANHNHPTQVVLSGAEAAIAQVEQRAAAEGIVTKRLAVATAFHSPIVAPAVTGFAEALAGVTFAAPAVPVWSNAAAAVYEGDGDAVRAAIAGAIAKPVRFVEQIEAMYAAGVRTFVEVGPGAVLSDLVDRILPGRPHLAVPTDRKGKAGVASLWEALGRLFVGGVAFDTTALWDGFDVPAAPARKAAMRLSINGANYQKPYPPEGGAAALPGPNAASVAPTWVHPVSSVAPTSHAPTPSAPSPLREEDMGQRSPSDDVQLAWVRAYQDAQRATIEAHAAWQHNMAETHLAFLRTVEGSFAGLSGVAGAPSASEPARLAAPIAWSTAAQAPAAPVYAAPAYAAPVYAAPPPAPVYAAPTPAPVAVAPVAVPPPRAPAAATSAADLEALMLSVVADKTGYPVEMLGLQMELEGDLGIDSIKRVEILSAVREKAKDLPEVDANELGQLRTLGQIVEALRGKTGAAPASAPSPGAIVVAAAPRAASGDVAKLLLDVVAEKTGYPPEMLGLQMELEGDLGIDSIKRVEILSAMREKSPGLPEVDASEMGQLRTLGHIVDWLKNHGAGQAPTVGTPTGSPTVDLQRVMLEVVADKTGYPVDALNPGLELEGDLGIDSIKRVEILSAVRERVPGLPEVDATELGQLRTLGQIADRLAKGLAGAPASLGPAPTAPLVVAPKALERGPIRRFVVRPVAVAACGLSPRGLAAGEIRIVDDGGGVAAALAARLTNRGLPAVVANDVEGALGAVIHLGGLRPIGTRADGGLRIREVFRDLRALAPRLERAGGLLVAVSDPGAADPIRAWGAGVASMAKTAALEWPKATVRAIDLSVAGRSADAVAAALEAEILFGGDTREVVLGPDGARAEPRMLDVPFTASAPSVGDDTVVLASGGARGVTAATLIALARATRCAIVLLGRTPLVDEPAVCVGVDGEAGLKRALLSEAQGKGKKVSPAEVGGQVAKVLAGREVRGTLAAITAAGGRARYVAGDVQDAVALKAALDGVRKDLGPIGAIVHGAGVLADKKIAEKTDEMFDRVFDTKVLGLQALLDATADDPVATVIVFSSVAARTGNLGQVDYAAANAVLDAVARAESRPGRRIRAIGWGPWRGGMVNPALASHFEKMGVAMIPIEVGAQMLVDEVFGADDDVSLVVGGAAGEGPLGAAHADRGRELEVHVEATDHPWLRDHTVGGQPVIPVALAIEWMARACKAARPDLAVVATRNLKVLRGIRLDGFEAGAVHTLTVAARQLSNGEGAVLSVELRTGPALHYSATVDMAERAPSAARGGATLDVPPAPGAEIYDGHVLFHGPKFQAIQSLDGLGPAGLVATVVGGAHLGWTGAWATDPVVTDAALQLAVLWARDRLGGASLPMAVASVQVWAGGLLGGPLRAVVRNVQVHDARAVCDVTILGGDGLPVLDLRGVEVVLRPGERRAPATPTA